MLAAAVPAGQAQSLTLTKVSAITRPDLIRLVYSTGVDPTTAGNAANYTLAGATIAQAMVAWTNEVVLQTSANLTSGTAYTLTVNGVQDAKGNAIAANTKATFKGPTLTQGFLAWDFYPNMETDGVDGVLTATNYPNMPMTNSYLASFDTTAITAGELDYNSLFGSLGDHYGDRISGYFKPPTSGDYEFFISSDDASRLYLSLDGDPANAQPICEETSCCNAFQESGAGQTSSAQTLSASQTYYLEAVHAEGGGGDYVKVAWRKVGDSTAASLLEPIPAVYFSAYGDPDNSDTISITKQPSPVTTTVGNKATFTVTVTLTGVGPLSYRWQKDQQDIAGAYSATYTTSVLSSTSDGGKFRCLVTLPGGKSVTSDEVQLTVSTDANPPVVASSAALRTTIGIAYDGIMDPASATNTANYTLSAGSVLGATLVKESTAVILTTSSLTGNSVTLTINGVKDLAGNSIAQNTQIALTLDSTLAGNFTATDIGNPTLVGSLASYESGKYLITAGGSGTMVTSGDQLHFAYETLTGDFDRKVQITGITGLDDWSRGGLMVRQTLDTNSADLKIVVANPTRTGGDKIAIVGRGLQGQSYTDWGRRYSGVSANLPNQWLRLRRIGNAFAMFVGTNGVDWAQVADRYQEFPSKVLVGVYGAAPTEGNQAVVNFQNYADATPVTTTAPVLVSAGTFNKTLVGVKFSKPVASATATNPANYTLSQGTVSAVAMGIAGDSVYLTVKSLTSDTFTVSVSGVKDPSGNTVTTGSMVTAKVSSWNSTDIGYIQDPANRPTPGDDPYRVGLAVPISSDEPVEVDIIGGGSNAWNNGDYVHYVYGNTPLTGDFDVVAAVERYDRSANQGSYSNSGLMLRSSVYVEGQEYTTEGTKAPHVANVTYLEYSGPGRGSIPLWRSEAGGGYGNGNANFGWTTVINGIKGYFGHLRSVDASGAVDAQSSATSARWLRIQRQGSQYNFLVSWDGEVWSSCDSQSLTLPDSLLFGFATMDDSGAGTPPFSAYGNNGHAIDELDPLNPAVVGGNVMNEANYVAQRIRIGKFTVPTVKASLSVASTSGKVVLSWPTSATGYVLQSTASLTSASWQDATQAVVVSGENNTVTISQPSGTQFFRLVKR